MIAILPGVAAGALTTVAGMGGGLALLVALMWWTGDPTRALAASAIGLLVGNVHRAWLFRAEIRKDILRPLAIGAVPAAILGGRLAVDLPDDWVATLIAVVALVGVAVAAFGVELHPPRLGIGAAGAAIGGVTATSGGGALLSGPLFLSLGLRGAPYVATGSAFAATIHVARLIGYGAGGALDAETLLLGIWLAVGIPVGNLLGRRMRRHLPEGAERPIELSVAGTVAALALFGGP